MQNPVIVDAIRSPMGRAKKGGGLADVHAVELLSQILAALVERNRLDPGQVDDVIAGCVSQYGEQAATPGRMAWLAAGFPEHVPSTTIDRKCGSSQQAVHFAAHCIQAGAYEIAIACGIESMSRVPMGSARGSMDPYGPSVTSRYSPGLISQGAAADLIAHRYRLTRRELDTFAAQSHQRALAAVESGAFTREIQPIATPSGVFERDETIRPATSVESLGTLAPVFRTDALAGRFPDIDWQTTAGNSSQMSDGAAAVLIMSERAASRLGLQPRARFVAFDVRGDDPLAMLTAPIICTRRVLAKARMSMHDIQHFEINEAFASIPLAWQRELGCEPERLNPRGGAIALGHPLGASGARLMTTMLHALEDSRGRFGLQSMCEAGGMANATIIERL
jgi:acetyl-CoA acyltransferase